MSRDPGSDDRGPLVSVVTPVYNGAPYLDESIRSVLAQTHTRWEHIICDNYSTDGTGEIAQRWAEQDPRIRVVKPPAFLPQSTNFNYALQEISPDSTYTKLIFADDWMFPDCLAAMIAVAERSESVVMVSAYRLVGTNGEGFGLPVEQTIVPGRDAGRLHFVNHKFLFGTPSTVMYRSAAVRARSPEFFPQGRFYFDTDVALQLFRDRDLGFVHQLLTYSRTQEDSITSRESSYYSLEIDRLIAVHSYGRDYLDAGEYAEAWRWIHQVYYECLGREWLMRRARGGPDDFWSYHERRLASAGLVLERRSVAAGALRALARAIASPLDVARGVVRYRRGARSWEQ